MLDGPNVLPVEDCMPVLDEVLVEVTVEADVALTKFVMVVVSHFRGS